MYSGHCRKTCLKVWELSSQEHRSDSAALILKNVTWLYLMCAHLNENCRVWLKKALPEICEFRICLLLGALTRLWEGKAAIKVPKNLYPTK